MSNPDPARIAGGIPAGGQFARNGHAEATGELPDNSPTVDGTDELREWNEAGISCSAEIARWKAHGFRTDTTDEYGAPTLGAWKATGLKPRTAAQWRDQGIDPEDVAEWRQLFSPEEAGRRKGSVSMEEAIRTRRELNSHPELWG